MNNPNISGMLVTLPNIKKMTLSTLWLSKVKGGGPPKLTVVFLALVANFSKFSNLTTVLFLDSFCSYLEELLLIQLSLTLENFIEKISKGLWDILGQTWHKMKKLQKWSPWYFCHLGYPWPQWKFALKKFSPIHYDMTSSPYKIHEWFSCFQTEKIWWSLCKNYKFCVIRRS